MHLKKAASSTLAALLLAALGATGSSAEEKVGQKAQTEQAKPAAEQAVMKINGKTITRREIDRSLKVALAQSGSAQVAPPVLKKAEEAVLEQLANSELLYQAAQEEGIKVLEKEVEEQIARNRGMFRSPAEYQAALAGMEMTDKEVEEFARRDIAINRLIEKRLGGNGEITEAEAMKFYEANRAVYFEKGESVGASHILVAVNDKATPEERKAAREKAEAILRLAKGGEDFAELAKTKSNCPSSAKGGDLGRIGKGETVPSFEKAAFALKPGELSEVVESPYGYHIIKVTEKIPSRTEKFEEVKARIVEYLKRQKIGAGVPALIKELREKAKIEKV